MSLCKRQAVKIKLWRSVIGTVFSRELAVNAKH